MFRPDQIQNNNQNYLRIWIHRCSTLLEDAQQRPLVYNRDNMERQKTLSMVGKRRIMNKTMKG